MWGQIATYAAKAAQALYDYLQKKAEISERERLQQEVLEAVSAAGDRVLGMMLRATAAELRGEFEGLQEDYLTYDPDPDDAVEETRLVSVIDRSSGLLGKLGEHIDEPRSTFGDPDDLGDVAVRDLALQCAALYAPLLYLRAQAMTERQYTYGAHEVKDISRSFDRAIHRFVELGEYLGWISNARFGPIHVVGEDVDSGRELFGYSFEGRSISLGRHPIPYSRAKRQREEHMASALRSYLQGAAPALAAEVGDMERIVEELNLSAREKIRRRQLARHTPDGTVASSPN